MFFLNCFYYWRRRTGHKGGSVLGSRSHHQEPEIPDSQRRRLRLHDEVLLQHLLLHYRGRRDCPLREPVKGIGLRPARRDHLQHLRSVLGQSSTSASHSRVESLQHLLPVLQWEWDFSQEDHRVQQTSLILGSREQCSQVILNFSGTFDS